MVNSAIVIQLLLSTITVIGVVSIIVMNVVAWWWAFITYFHVVLAIVMTVVAWCRAFITYIHVVSAMVVEWCGAFIIYIPVVSAMVVVVGVTLFSIYRIAVDMRTHKKITWDQVITQLGGYTLFIMASHVMLCTVTLPIIININAPWSVTNAFGAMIQYIYTHNTFVDLKISAPFTTLVMSLIIFRGCRRTSYMGSDVDDIEDLITTASFGNLSRDDHRLVTRWFTNTNQIISGAPTVEAGNAFYYVVDLVMIAGGGYVALAYQIFKLFSVLTSNDFGIWEPYVSSAFSWIGVFYAFQLFDSTTLSSVYEKPMDYHHVYVACAAWQIAVALNLIYNTSVVVDAAFRKRFHAIRNAYIKVVSVASTQGRTGNKTKGG
jgi:hypothetical protein